MQTAREFAQANRESFIRDLKRLVEINSIKSEPAPNAPYGRGVRRAQLEAMKLASEMGFETVRDCEGRISYAHFGPTDRFIGIISHADVVPVGDGWFGDPFVMEEKDGFLVGRGTGDDKGPLVAGMYACKYVIENRIPLKYGIRLLIGCDEECGMSDLDYYLENYPEPVFTFSPDAGFPVCNGEKGIYSSDLVSPAFENGAIRYLSGGLASNVVCDLCTARLDGSLYDAVRAAAGENEAYEVTLENGETVVKAFGKAAHAGMPFDSVNANGRILELLLDAGVLAGGEKEAAEFIVSVVNSVNGAFLGIAGDDGRFATNSIIGGMLRLREDGRLCLNVNSRYNTSIPMEEIERRIEESAAAYGFTVENVEDSGPIYLDPETPAVKIMNGIFNEVTGLNEEPYVMSGGTYARKLHNAVAFGPEMPGEVLPDWVGGAHMKNEAISIDSLIKAIEIYAQSLIKLQDVEF